jgi:signal transduction histidine kinase
VAILTLATMNRPGQPPRSRRFTAIVDGVSAVVLAATVLLGSIGEATGREIDHLTGTRPGVPAYALVVVASLVLIWRRRWPVATFAIALAGVLAYSALGYENGAALLAPSVGLFTVAVAGDARRALLLGAVALVSLMTVYALCSPFGTGASFIVIPFEVATSLFLGLVVAIRVAYVAEIQDRAERAERTRDEEARRQVDAERLRIARELHDAVAHNISVINIQVRVAAQVIPDPPEPGALALAAIKEASVEALSELRNILGLLRQADEAEPTTPTPGMDQLETLVSAAGRAGLSVRLTVVGEPYRPPPTVDVAAYRIVQESLTNALRYAASAAVDVRVGYRPDGVTVEIADDGSTEAPANGTIPQGSGHGIIGMRERAVAAGGTLDAGPTTGGGFRVLAGLPVVAAP